MLVSIIIPTYNDWKRLSLCLNALENQSFPKNDFEIIVVNNNPSDSMPEGYTIPSNCTLMTEARPGSYASRNAAVKVAGGKIIGFTDSDCIPDKDWIANAIAYFQKNISVMRIGGKVELFYLSGSPNKVEIYDSIYAFNQTGYVKKHGTAVTANMFTYKNVFDKIGLFNEKLLSGGDFHWGTIAFSKGLKIDYVENVVVKHPARHQLSDLIRKEKRVGGGQAGFIARESKLKALGKFLFELRPRASAAKYIMQKGKELSYADLALVYLMHQYFVSIRALSKFKVQIGYKAERL